MPYPPPGTPGRFTRKADASAGVQFDGQLATLTTIFDAAVASVGAAGVQVVSFWGLDNLIDSVTVSGGSLPEALTFSRTDWVLLPDTPGEHMKVFTDAEMRKTWDAA